MRYWTGGVCALFLALVQASSVEQFRILGVAPNLLLVLLVAWLVVRGLDDVLPMIGVAGITLGFVGLQTPGLVLLALLPIAGCGVLREMHVIHSDLLLAMALVVGATIAYESVLLISVMFTGGGLDLSAAVSSVIVPSAIVNALLTPAVYLVMRVARPHGRGRGLAY